VMIYCGYNSTTPILLNKEDVRQRCRLWIGRWAYCAVNGA